MFRRQPWLVLLWTDAGFNFGVPTWCPAVWQGILRLPQAVRRTPEGGWLRYDCLGRVSRLAARGDDRQPGRRRLVCRSAAVHLLRTALERTTP